jgi:hypothetical protein
MNPGGPGLVVAESLASDARRDYIRMRLEISDRRPKS